MTDEQLEQSIEAARQQMLEARDVAEQQYAALVMCDLIKLRSPSRIAQMEIERGLR